jgi:predicted transcriptional regulator
MRKRVLTITLSPDRRAALRSAGAKMAAAMATGAYQGEDLSFETPGAFFANLTERRWEIVHALQGQGALAIRELARRVERDVKRVHEDVMGLITLGLIERADDGAVQCPYAEIHIDMRMHAPVAEAA